MAYVRKSLADAVVAGRSDPAKLDATTEADIRRWQVEDGEDPDAPLPETVRVVESPASLRARVGLTQPAMAARLRVPVKTWRNWEQGRVNIEPAARALLDLVAADPERAFQVLARRVTSIADYAVTGSDRYVEVKGRIAGRPSQALDAVKALSDVNVEGLDAALRKL